MRAALAQTADHFLIGQHGAQRRAPIDRGLGLIGQAVPILIAADRVGPLARDIGGNRQLGDRPAALGLVVVPGVVQHQKDPLRPAEVADVGRGQLPGPVVAEAQHFFLPAERGDVLLGRDPRRRAGFLGVLLGRQAEGVPAHRVHHALAVHPGVAADNVGSRLPLGMAHVQPVAAGIREHIQHVELLARGQPRRGERALHFPVLLPLGLDECRVVAGHE